MVPPISISSKARSKRFGAVETEAIIRGKQYKIVYWGDNCRFTSIPLPTTDTTGNYQLHPEHEFIQCDTVDQLMDTLEELTHFLIYSMNMIKNSTIPVRVENIILPIAGGEGRESTRNALLEPDADTSSNKSE